jgi:orotidine-5'-phosphate decarboxylase
MTPAARIFVAIDRAEREGAARDVGALAGAGCGIKLGLEFFVANGPEGVAATMKPGLALFLDLKLHDIPNTVAGAIRGACRVRPRYVTLHASGGLAMMLAARRAAEDTLGSDRPRLLGITVLTSLDAGDLYSVGQLGPIADQARRLADLAQRAGVDGVVCSPHEVAALRAQCGRDFVLVAPGIRPSWAEAQDQKRVMTPAQAIAAGADHLVIGRPITQANDPREALTRIAAEIAGAR